MDRFDLLDDRAKINEADKSGMLKAVEGMPDMLRDAWGLSEKVSPLKIKNIRQIVISGMGGSAIAGNIVTNLLLGKARIPVYVNRGYKVPAFVGRETLFFALSYSGNTEETINALKEAAKHGANVVCVTSGGKLKDLAGSNGYQVYLIPSGYQPRAALPYLLAPILKSLGGLGMLPRIKEELSKAIDLLRRLKDEYGPREPLRGNPVKQLAKKLCGKIPIIFGSMGATDAAALRFKTQFNENSKVTALFNVFPELNHNEIVNLSVLKREEHNFSLIFLRDEGDFELVQRRMEITKSLIGRQVGGVNEVWAHGKSLLSKILSLIYFGDFLSVYLAILRGIDPTPVEVITRLKKELRR